MIEFSVNHPIFFVMVGLIIAVVMAQSVFFLVRALRRAKEIGMDKTILRKTIIAASIFTIAPAVAILIGVITLSKSLGIPLPWLRLSVIGSQSYETIAAERTLSELGAAMSETITNPQTYITVTWVMTLGIAVGLILVPILTKRVQNGLISLGNRDKKWAEILNNAMFLGMISAFLGYVFSDVLSVLEGSFVGLIPVCVMLTSALVMLIFGLLNKLLKWRWLADYAIPVSLLAGMAMAIPYTNWLG
jgi:hypothetical protein